MPISKCCKNTEQEHQLTYTIRKKKWEYKKQICEEGEKLYTAKEIRQIYQNTNSIRKEFKTNSLFFKDKRGNIIAKTVDILERWA
jgi:hypothetical protein